MIDWLLYTPRTLPLLRVVVAELLLTMSPMSGFTWGARDMMHLSYRVITVLGVPVVIMELEIPAIRMRHILETGWHGLPCLIRKNV